ncbi:MAG: hypothetical protein HYX84_01860 [Chloroflexi bacterium]|nr:hypothetical protein [Chloroflexota bacterium]
MQELDYLGIINAVIAQHHALLGQVKLAEGRTNDLEALFNLQRAYAHWTQSSIETLLEKQSRLEEIRTLLHDGLERHFGFEEKYLPPLLGEFLMKSIINTHRAIMEQFRQAKPVLTAPRLQEMKQEELLLYKLNVEQVVSQLCQAIEQHLATEEVLLGMLKGVLEQRGAQAN